MIIDAWSVNAFVWQGEGGNAAGVVLDADGLNETHMQTIAAQLGHSETAFVMRDPEVDFQVRFFTPSDEVDFCGHATVACFSYMFQHAGLKAGHYVQRTRAGVLGVEITPDGEVIMDQALPVFKGTLEPQKVAAVLGIGVDDILCTGLPVEVVSTGLPDGIVPVASGALSRLKPDMPGIAEFSRQHNLIGLHVFSLELGEVSASCRNFAPAVDIPEESATGSACGALASYLFKHTGATEFVFEQGRSMGALSRLQVVLSQDKGEVSRVRVSGRAIAAETHCLNLAE